MKFGGRVEQGDRDVSVNLAPVVSICLLLIAFFLISLRLHSSAGAAAARAASPGGPLAALGELPTIKIRLQADAQGNLAGIAMNRRPLKDLDELRSEILAIVRDTGGSPEVEFDCDYHLRYEITLKAVAAVSGPAGDGGRLSGKLVQRVKFAPRRQEKRR